MLDGNGYPLEFDQKKEDEFLREITIQALVRNGASRFQVIDILRKLCTIDRVDFTEDEIGARADKYLRSEEIMGETARSRSIQTEVEKWLSSNTSNSPCYSSLLVSLHDCYLDLNLRSPNEKASCRVAFKRLVEKGKIEPVSNRSGQYRYLNGNIDELDFMNADTTPFDIRFPLGVHELVEIYKKSVIVLAGEPNAGKTAFLLNLAKKNMLSQDVTYYSSEMGAAELQIRLKKFNRPLEEWKKVKWVARSGDFDKAINPNGLNIIDYLEVAKDFYEIGGLLTNIFNALDQGVAVVGLQKPPGRDVGVGGARTLDKARLYLSIEPGILKIVKGKIWRQECVNPNGMYIRWLLGGGANFKIQPDNDGSTWRKP